jgi:hypothetical protein
MWYKEGMAMYNNKGITFIRPNMAVVVNDDTTSTGSSSRGRAGASRRATSDGALLTDITAISTLRVGVAESLEKNTIKT